MSPDLRAVILQMNREERLELLDEAWNLEADGLPGDRWEDVRERLRGHP